MIPGALLAWLTAPSGRTGLWLHGSGKWNWSSYESLAEAALSFSAVLDRQGFQPGDMVLAPTDQPRELVASLFGCLHIGGVAVPIDRTAKASVARVRAVVQLASDTRCNIFARDLDRWPREASARVREVGRPTQASPSSGARADGALVQFTSGTSGPARGVIVSPDQVAGNISMIRDWLGWTEHDSAASWLPLSHDMGMVGLLLTSVVAQTTLWLMTPTDFLRAPRLWLERLTPGAATITAAPAFGYTIAERRAAADARHLDLRAWRHAVVGAERLDADALASFLRAFAPAGMSPEVLRPAYGLAEATLAVTGHHGQRAARLLQFSGDLALGQRPKVGLRATLDQPGNRVRAGALVSSGTALRGLDVHIAGIDGQRLPEGHVGEICVDSPSVARKYADGSQVPVGPLHTGDVGLMDGGELFVFGRAGDSISVNGRQVFMEELDHAVASGLGLPPGSCVAVSVPRASGNTVRIFIERAPPSAESVGVQAARRLVGHSVDVRVVKVPRRAIPRTSSGKPMRSWLAQHYG